MTPTAPPLSPRETQAFEALRANLAAALRARTDARAILQEAYARLRSSDWPGWLEYARAFSTVGAPSLAADLLGEATRRWPRNPELRVGWGESLSLSQRVAEAEAVFRDVLRLHPDHQQAAWSLALMLRQCGRVDAACAVVFDLWQRLDKTVEMSLKTGQFFEECRRPRLAAQLYESVLAEGEQDARVMAASGNVATALGQFQAGRERLLAALDAGLDLREWSGIFLRLAAGQRYASSDHPDFGRFEHALVDGSLSTETHIAAGFALGKARIDVGDFKGAVDVLGEANAMEHRRRPWSAPAYDEFIAAQIAAPLPPAVPFLAAFEDVIPVFVVGLPRTGTTLVEAMLARHPQVRGRGEMDWLPFLAFELAARRLANDPVALRQVASTYLVNLRQDDAPARWYIDKNPHNFRHLGLIASLFPQARIIHCTRDRRDTALSIWCQLFAHRDVDYAYDLADIATFARGHDRLMEHWRRSLELPVFELEYERMVDQPAAMMHELGDFLGLSVDAFEDQEPGRHGAIATASVWQARQPIHRESVGRWREFEPYLPELLRCFPTPDRG